MQKRIKNKVFILFGLCLIGIIFAALLIKANYLPMTKMYHSDVLKMTFEYPADYQLTENLGEIIVKNKSGEILIHRTGTNYADIKSFFENEIESSNLEKNIDRNYFKQNNLDYVEALIKYPSRPEMNRKVYYIYKEHGVYAISTSSPTLYHDLDMIAESFRYER